MYITLLLILYIMHCHLIYDCCVCACVCVCGIVYNKYIIITSGYNNDIIIIRISVIIHNGILCKLAKCHYRVDPVCTHVS